jgi:hypothetical protein
VTRLALTRCAESNKKFFKNSGFLLQLPALLIEITRPSALAKEGFTIRQTSDKLQHILGIHNLAKC